jgi:carboxypeptidase Taq
VGIYETFEAKVRRISKLNSISALLRWDQETHLPKMGASDRADQLALLASWAHEEFVSREMGGLIAALKEEEVSGRLDSDARVNLREVGISFDREKKLPAELVEEISLAHARGFQSWAEAREAKDFNIFAPCLERNVELQQKVAELYGFQDHPYNALLDLYERGATVRQLTAMFEGLKEHVVPILEVAERNHSAGTLAGTAPAERQAEFAERLARQMGFDFTSGRLDCSEHPFTTSLSPRDVRLTLHYYSEDPLRAIFTILHEGGHGLYRQGTEWEHRGLPTGEIVSAGVDESQARFWENLVGRGRAFWRYALPQFQKAFPGLADHLDVDSVYALVNQVKRSLIRVGADELTYNLHILLRFEIERDLLGGLYRVPDLPEIWNEKMQQYLGLTPPGVIEGVLQDPHWADSYFGYFPTYTLGNLYAAQFGRAIRRDIPDTEDRIAQGDFRLLREWLRENIHRYGKRLSPGELIERATGSPPSSDAFVEYVQKKYLRP